MGMRGTGGESEMTVTVAKSELIAILVKNRAVHVEEFEAACRIWREKMIKELAVHGEALREYAKDVENRTFDKIGPYPQPRLNELPKPVSYVKSYDRALGMLRLHAKDELTLDMTSYRQYVEDDWDWKGAAMLSNSRYLGG